MRNPELRNRIYDLIVEDLTNCKSDHAGGLPLKRCPDCPVLIHKPTVQHDRSYFLPTVAYRSYFRLTQTCRIIRNEYRRSYLINAEVVIPLDMLKRYTKTFVEGVDYPHGGLSTTVRVTGPTRRLGHGGVDFYHSLSGRGIIANLISFSITHFFLNADTALLKALNKLFDKRYEFIDLANDGHITQVRMREIPVKYS